MRAGNSFRRCTIAEGPLTVGHACQEQDSKHTDRLHLVDFVCRELLANQGHLRSSQARSSGTRADAQKLSLPRADRPHCLVYVSTGRTVRTSSVSQAVVRGCKCLWLRASCSTYKAVCFGSEVLGSVPQALDAGCSVISEMCCCIDTPIVGDRMSDTAPKPQPLVKTEHDHRCMSQL